MLSETLLIDVTGPKQQRDAGLMERDGFIYSFFAGCFSLDAGMGPSTTDNIYFVMRRVRGVCELE